ncbi:MAG TPA: DUF4126 domain-containing protein [Ignavibacteriaceae bacterium]
MSYEIILTVLMGIGLSAASGFRIFVPFLVISIASISGNLTLADSFSWIGTVPALITFSVATVLEIAGYFIPWVDNILDTIATPTAVIAGIILTASVITGMSPLLKWTLAIIAGGGVAAAIQAITGVTRVTSTATTGGLGNPVVSSAELGGSLLLALIAVFIPVIAAVITILLVFWSIKFLVKKLNVKRNPS